MDKDTVFEVMSRRVMDVQALDRLSLAQQYMAWGGFRHLPVLRKDRLVGVLSERDVLRHLAEHGDAARQALVEDAMSAPAVTVGPYVPAIEAVRQMATSRIGCLPVVDAGHLVGIMTTTDVLLDRVRSVEGPGSEGTAEAGPARSAADVMSAPAVVARRDHGLLEATRRMIAAGVRHLPVVDDAGRLVGMLSEWEVRTAVGDPFAATQAPDPNLRISSWSVGDVMTTRPAVVAPELSIRRLARRFVDSRVGAVAVVGPDDRLEGIVSYVDLLRASLSQEEERP